MGSGSFSRSKSQLSVASANGKYILYNSSDSKGKNKSDVWALPLFGERKAFPVVSTEADEQAGVFSPDGKWVAYHSNESGKTEVYIMAFPTPSGRHQISS